INQALYVAIDKLYTEGYKIDPVEVFDKLPEDLKKDLQDLGGWRYIQNLIDTPIDPENITLEVDALRQVSFNRRMAKFGQEITAYASNDSTAEQKISK